MIKVLFTEARKHDSAIIFIDEIDSLCSARSENENESTRRVKTEFLVQMEGLNNKGGRLLVLGATNIPWGLDQAVKRRFEKRIYIPLPDESARLYMLKKKIEEVPYQITDEQFKDLTKRCENYSGSDIEVLCKDAAMEPLRFAQNTMKFQKVNTPQGQKYQPVHTSTPADGYNVIQSSVYDLPDRSLVLPAVSHNDFVISMKRSKCSVSLADLKQYEEWTKMYGEEGA